MINRAQQKPSPVMSSLQKLSLLIACFILSAAAAAGVESQATTDPSEASALKPILRDWENSSRFFSINWNLDADLCQNANREIITCDCTFNNSTLCHVTAVYAINMEIGGEFPQGIKNLAKLEILNMGGNYFSGPIPPFIGNMTELVHLNLESNLFNGTIPAELGNLRKLKYLNMGINQFNGSLPDSLGHLSNLQDLRLNSIHINGRIPQTFDQLKKLRTLWISDNNLTEEVPSFFGNLKELQSLRLQGNAFRGPIPSTFSQLTNLTDLRIGEVKGGRTELLDIKDLRSLEILILRNNDISGIIPSNFGNNTKLKHLDLSFNNLEGPVPGSLFRLPFIEYLSLGNNMLNGSLPNKKNDSWFLDLSHNYFSGSFPSWANRNVNLVANDLKNLGVDSLKTLNKLERLQRSFLNVSNPQMNTGFAINCGGSVSINSTFKSITFIYDNATLDGETPYYITSDYTWAVTSTGRFLDVHGPNYIQSIQSVFEGTLDSDLFKDMRLSASSLRYYGLGMENGNYTVSLDFGETLDYWDTRKGRRLFDIYIQGKLEEKDFDITANVPNRAAKTAVSKNWTVSVGQNFIEIHLFWAGKGTCCVPNKMSYGPSIAALIVVSAQQKTPQSISKSKVALIVGLSIAVCLLLVMSIVGIFTWWLRSRQKEDNELLSLTIKPKLFSYEELKSATGNFGKANKLGQGGFGSVFRGVLSDGEEIAVKELTVSSDERMIQFITEVATVSTVQHRNLVKLLGCCCEGKKRLLVYEYLINKSLDKAFSGQTNLYIDWAARFKICLGVARGLAYLHEESSLRIIHRDVKASNILLDADLNPKISDFGLAKSYDLKMTHVSTRVAGTVGYLAPEYAMRGQLTEKADVYGFGVVAFEILTGRPNTLEGSGIEKMFLLDWVWQLKGKKCELEMMDGKLSSYNQEEALLVMKVAFMCTQASPAKRPSMSRVVAMLLGDMEVEEIDIKPSYLMDWRYYEKFSESSSSHLPMFSSPTLLLTT